MTQRVVIISEIGINHSGSLDLAKQLIKASKEAGVDLVKFQKRDINKTYSKTELDKPRESPWGTTNRQQKEGLEFGKEQYDEIDRYCKELEIGWFASPWDLPSVEFLTQYNLKFNKIASALITHRELCHAIAMQKKYTYISTGMSTLDEISHAVDIFNVHECPFELMSCNSTYPCAEEKANLRCIRTLAHLYNCKVGYSSHCVGIIDCVGAVALGASSIEKHITMDRAAYGSDQAASVEPSGFKRMIDYIRAIEISIGDGIKRVTDEEQKVKAKLRREKDYD